MLWSACDGPCDAWVNQFLLSFLSTDGLDWFAVWVVTHLPSTSSASNPNANHQLRATRLTVLNDGGWTGTSAGPPT